MRNLNDFQSKDQPILFNTDSLISDKNRNVFDKGT